MAKKQEETIKVLSIIGSIVCYGLSSFILGGLDQRADFTGTLIEVKDQPSIIVYEKRRGEDGMIVASKSGKKYYFPWCSGINRIKEENKIFFTDEVAAEARGLTLSKTCD